MKEIELSKGQVALVDDDDYEWISKMSWYARWQGNRFYATTGIYEPETQKTYNISLHSFIMMPDRGEVVDHINGNSLDNRRENLRIVTQRENLKNKRGLMITREQVRAAIAEIIRETAMENDYGQLTTGARMLAEKLGLSS